MKTDTEMRLMVSNAIVGAINPLTKEVPMPIFLMCFTEMMAAIIAEAVAHGADEEMGLVLVHDLVKEGIVKIKDGNAHIFGNRSIH